jgi:hypothetical protein
VTFAKTYLVFGLNQTYHYFPIFANIITKATCQSGTDHWQLALAFQVDEDMIEEWIDTYKDFRRAAIADDAVENSLIHLALGYEYHDVEIFG